MNEKMKKTVKKIFVFPLFLIYFLIVEVWISAGIYHVWDKISADALIGKLLRNFGMCKKTCTSIG